MEKIHTEGTRFLTESGRQMIFNGINYMCKEPSSGYMPDGIEDTFRAFREKGFNLIRFGIFWDGVEHEPGIINTDYLSEVKKVMRLAESWGLYVILDMHQDLFSVKFGDGAPLWATLDEGLPHPENCIMWYEAYLKSEAIIKAADNFWLNAPACDGKGLLDHYGDMWIAIAEYFEDCDNIIGLEPMNEPYMGSAARNAFGAATVRIMEKFPSFDLNRPDQIPPKTAAAFMGYVAEKLQEWDRTVLMDFYRRMERAVRKVTKKPIVTGGNIYSSSNVHTGIQRLETAQIYAPHGYDAVVDSDRYDAYSKENIEMIFADKKATQDELKLPVVCGEWGAFPSKDYTGRLLDHFNGILEKNLWSSTYWTHIPGLEHDPNLNNLSRPYPREICGKLVSYSFDRDNGTLTVELDAAEGETRIYCQSEPQEVTADTALSYRFEAISGTAGELVIKQERPESIHIKICF